MVVLLTRRNDDAAGPGEASSNASSALLVTNYECPIELLPASLVSNAVASVVVSIREGACDRDILRRELDGGCVSVPDAVEPEARLCTA